MRLSNLAAALLTLSFARPVYAAEPFTITSPAFADNGQLVLKNGGAMKENPNCRGENMSPPLAWSNVPEGTKSFVLFMWDPEGRFGTGVSHWVAYGIPANVTSLAEGEASKETPKIVGGKNASGSTTYFGPCPAANTGLHHYVISIVATGLEPTALKAGLTREEVMTAMTGHGKGVTAMVARMGY
jgi:Raf kinase inhibitor-like YbhB/YbcL family protein